jgi:hypothetical protein
LLITAMALCGFARRPNPTTSWSKSVRTTPAFRPKSKDASSKLSAPPSRGAVAVGAYRRASGFKNVPRQKDETAEDVDLELSSRIIQK